MLTPWIETYSALVKMSTQMLLAQKLNCILNVLRQQFKTTTYKIINTNVMKCIKEIDKDVNNSSSQVIWLKASSF